MVGAFDDITFDTETCEVPPGATIFLYSDGVFEITRTDGTMWPFEEFATAMSAPPDPKTADMDRLIASIRTMSGKDGFDDDFSIIELRF